MQSFELESIQMVLEPIGMEIFFQVILINALHWTLQPKILILSNLKQVALSLQ